MTTISSNPFKIVSIGEALWDDYGESRQIGGAPANIAVHLSHLGHDVLLLSRVGSDPLGEALLKALAEHHVRTELVQNDPAIATGVIRVHVSPEGIPRYQCSIAAAFDYFEFSEHWSNALSDADAIFWGTLAQRHERSRNVIQGLLSSAPSTLKVFDLNLRRWEEASSDWIQNSLRVANIVKANEQELAFFKKGSCDPQTDVQFVEQIVADFSLDLFALTLGERGCLFITPHETVQINGLGMQVVDSTGAGDAFAAGLIHSWLWKKPLRETAAFASQLATECCRYRGATGFWGAR